MFDLQYFRHALISSQTNLPVVKIHVCVNILWPKLVAYASVCCNILARTHARSLRTHAHRSSLRHTCVRFGCVRFFSIGYHCGVKDPPHAAAARSPQPRYYFRVFSPQTGGKFVACLPQCSWIFTTMWSTRVITSHLNFNTNININEATEERRQSSQKHWLKIHVLLYYYYISDSMLVDEA